MSIPVVDIFAGPGGLGEGFASVKDEQGNFVFRTVVSAEMEASAHKTLRLRAFKRLLERNNSLDGMKPLYDYYETGDRNTLEKHPLWEHAVQEAQQLTLGDPEDNKKLDEIILDAGLSENKHWVLIGGPPCQAYSLVGRARNKGINGYKPEEDKRHFLYREYLRLIQQFKPAVFVMENVKGILSSKVENQHIFHSILEDLNNPDTALNTGNEEYRYKIHALSKPVAYSGDLLGDIIKPHDFIVRAEDYGIPQARHRVVLVGVRSDIAIEPDQLVPHTSTATVAEALGQMPKLRSKISRRSDIAEEWENSIKQQLKSLHKSAKQLGKAETLIKEIENLHHKLSGEISTGAIRFHSNRYALYDPDVPSNDELELWLQDQALISKSLWLNHEARGHMESDLGRYAFASCFANANNRSPKGHREFDLPGLSPAHKNWESGKFSDRFRVQVKGKPSTTVTSHISKDGHYFIHPDPSQCRSLTVREAARLQTFPDNYFFEGNRTQQYVQVGNAVPPMLANKIALIVKRLLERNG